MKTGTATLLALALLAATAPPVAAADLRYQRWEAPTIPVAIDEVFLQSKIWDLRDLDFGAATPLESSGLRDEDPTTDRVRVGLGMLLTPAGEFPTVLSQETVHLDGDRIAIQYRWLGLGHTTLALIRGPIGSDLPKFPAASMVTRLAEGVLGAGMRVYNDEVGPGVLSVPGGSGADIFYNFDASPDPDANIAILLSTITTQGYATGIDLTSATVWDFTPTASLSNAVVAQTDTPLNLDETCNAERCGFSLPGIDFMSRQDNLTDGTKVVVAFENEDLCEGGGNDGLACDLANPATCPSGTCISRQWLRAGAQLEGTNSESRFCYDGQIDADGGNRGQVRQWSFTNPDAGRAFMQVGDSWVGDDFQCTINLFNQNCGVPVGGFIPAEAKTSACADLTGHFTTEILNEGSVKLPSGHWVDVLVFQQVAEFCVYFATSSCTFLDLARIRQPVVLFVAPGEGTVVQVNGDLSAPDPQTWNGVNETRVRFGLLPPLAIQADSSDDTNVTLSWTPGDQFGYIDRAKIYWDTDSGDNSGYSFDSDSNSGQVVFGPNGPDGFPLSATINGLTPGTQYFLTVTFLDMFTEPGAAPFAYEYESRLYPTTIKGTVDGLPGGEVEYPAEVTGTTTNPGCLPTTEVANLMVVPDGGGDFIFSWDAVADACLDHYVLLGANDPTDAANFTQVASTGISTSYTGNPAFAFYLVVADGAGGQRGPLGHFGQ